MKTTVAEMAKLESLCGIKLGQNPDKTNEVLEAYYDFLCGSEPLNQIPYYLLLLRKKGKFHFQCNFILVGFLLSICCSLF